MSLSTLPGPLTVEAGFPLVSYIKPPYGSVKGRSYFSVPESKGDGGGRGAEGSLERRAAPAEVGPQC